MAKIRPILKSKQEPAGSEAGTTLDGVPSRRRRILLMAGAPALVLLIAGGGLILTGRIANPFAQHRVTFASGPVFVKVPEIVANLNAPGDQNSYVKLKATLELPNSTSVQAVLHDMPRIVDVFQSYLRAMHPSELSGASGTYRLREALIDRVRIAAAPSIVDDVLFEELIVQ
ncbi:MAG TPA: flagellar basal body-associated FliL family protein [Acidiphilium sp.]